MIAYLSIGSNLGDRGLNMRQAIRRLSSFGQVLSVSAFYETEPVEVVQEQPWFLNCAVALETELGPKELLRSLLALEQAMGRRRSEPKGPRAIDIDIVFFGDFVLNLPDLKVPHPAMEHRRFVLEPLAEIAPDHLHPVLKRCVSELLSALPREAGIVRKYQGA